jgi:hypothetical protein
MKNRKKTVYIFLLIILMATGLVMAKKSKMDPELLAKVKQYLSEMTFAVVVKSGVPSSPGYVNKVIIKDAGERPLYWEAYANSGSEHIKSGDIMVLEEVITKEKGYVRLKLRTIDKRTYLAKKLYTTTIKDTDLGTVKEVQREKEEEVSHFFRSMLEFRFNEKHHANTPENYKFIMDTIGQGFKFFKTKGDALVYIDSEMDDGVTIKVGMTVADVVRKMGLPNKKEKSEDKIIYFYDQCSVTFIEGKAIKITNINSTY